MIEGIIISTAILLLLVVFIVLLLSEYQRKKNLHLKEKEVLYHSFQQELLRTQIEIQEQTFNHISQEIHDNVGQVLSLAKVQASIMKETKNLEMVDDVKEHISKALTDLRDIAKSLSSERIRNMSIVDAVQIETDRINKSGILQAGVSCEGKEIKMDEQKKQILLRIIQECLQNIIKHAHASEVRLQFTFKPEGLNVYVKDNGNGFDVNKAMSNSTGLGLQNIKTRASLIGAALAIESTLNEGSILTINIPYE
jgi:two-component system, NarL family, sensor kinase